VEAVQQEAPGAVMGVVWTHVDLFNQLIKRMRRAEAMDLPGMKRFKKEAAELSNDSIGVSAEPMGEDMKRWKGTISGPKDTPYDAVLSFTAQP
jgi:hypothetical protein